MKTLEAVADRFSRSLALRWVALVTFGSWIWLSVIVGFTSHELHARLEKEGEAIMQLAEQKTAERIDGEIKLVAQRLKVMMGGLEDNLAGIANLPSTLAAIRSRNDAKIAEDVGKRMRRAGFTGGIVVDHKLAVIGADRAGTELASSHAALRQHDLRETFRELVESNDVSRPNAYRFIGSFDHSLGAILRAPVQDRYGLLVSWPVFDDFGEPAGLIVGFYILKSVEPVLTSFAETIKASVMLQNVETPIAVAGGIPMGLGLTGQDQSGLVRSAEYMLAGRCAASLPSLTICVLHSESEILRFRDEITAIGVAESEKTNRKLVILCAIGLLVMMLCLSVLAHRLTRPLTEITEAVERVSRGEWRVDVRHAERSDEVGMIARAVADMQVSLIERDRMRQEMVRIDALNQRRLMLGNAVSRFEDGMAVVMRNIGTTLGALSDTNQMLDRAARDADQQAERIRSTSMETASTATQVSGATMQLSNGIREIAERVKTTHSVVHRSGDQLRQTEASLDACSAVTRDAGDALADIQSLIADLGHLALNASLEAVQAGEMGRPFSPLAAAVSQVAARTAEAAERIAAELARIDAATGDAASALDGAQSGLGDAIRETSEISVVIAEQNAATLSIADGLTGAADAMLGLTEAVDHLRMCMSGAQDATSDFVSTARRIVDDAKAIDESIRSFVREVAA